GFAMPDSFDTDRKIEITFWAKNDTNRTQKEIYNKAIADFQALYPNVTVKILLYTDYSRIYNDVITNISTDTTPNVCITYPDHIATYITGDNTVVPLDDIFDDPRYGLGGSELRYDSPKRSEMSEKFMDECVINGKHYAIPFMRSTEACYINVTLLNKLGYELPDKLTWDFVWEVSDAATAQDAEGNFLLNGQKVLIPFIYKSTDNMMIQQVFQKGAGFSDANGGVYLFNDTVKELLYTVAEHTAKGSFSTFQISSYPGNYLNAGQCVFAIDSTAGATWMGGSAPHMDISSDQVRNFEIAVRAIPQFDVENPKMISQGPSICVFNKSDPQEVLASWLFAQYLLTNEVQIDYSTTEGYIPVTEKAHNSAEYKDYLSRRGEDNDLHYAIKIDAAKLLLDNIGNTFVTPVFNGSASLRSASGQLIESVARSVRRKETVDDAYLERLFSDTRSLYRLNQTGRTAENEDLGELPSGSVALLVSLAVIWIILLLFVIISTVKKKKSV
ncbi:MAG: extracellular solute-binding protein, partial [Clostridia bacterium]|nr:extracellular solute-binding protein [Clostridia bacterium]